MGDFTDVAEPQLDWAELIRTYQAGVWRFLRVLGCEASLAEDLTQETFVAAMEGAFRHYDPAATAAFLRKTAANLYVSTLRRAGRVLPHGDVERLDREWTRWAGHDGGDDLLDALRDCLPGLTDRAQTALQMRFRDQASRDEIAQALSLSENGAKNLMQRAKAQLRDCIRGKLP